MEHDDIAWRVVECPIVEMGCGEGQVRWSRAE